VFRRIACHFSFVVDQVRMSIPGLRFRSAQVTVSTVARA
jgi:hypothetical protein